MNRPAPPSSEPSRAYLDGLVRASRTPGIQYLVVDPTRILFEYAAGCADLRHRTPMTPITTMMAYSMSKTITAAAVMRLVQAGKVGLDAPVADFVDFFPYGREVLVRQLLAHTSGIPNPIPLRWVHLADRHAGFDETAALREVLGKYPRLRSRPGTRYAYSNIGYWLLGQIVARAAGQSFVSYVRERVLDPIATAEGVLDYTIVPGNHAAGYLEKYSLMNLGKRLLIDQALIGEYTGRWLSIRSHYVNGPAFGGLVGTARGFATFLQDQLAPHSRILNDEARRQFYAPQTDAAGQRLPMTLGWHVGELRGVRHFYKEGGGGGFHSMMRLYPEPAIGTVMMVNATGLDVATHLDHLDAGCLWSNC